MLLWFLLACAPSTHVGLVQLQGERVVLVEPDGREVRVDASGAGAPLAYLEGARVEVTARGMGRTIRPQGFRVTDAGDGSAPFVGRLRRYGSNWLLDDQNSGMTIVLVEDSLGTLQQHEGRLVLVIGYVVGAQRVNVVLYKVLEPTSTDAPPPPGP